MNKRNLFTIGGAVVLGLALVALPANSARPQKADDSKIAHLEQRIEELEAKLQAQMESQQVQAAELADADAPEAPQLTLMADAMDYVKISLGQLDGTAAFMQGKLKIKGDMGLAIKMASLFRRPT